MSTLPLAPHKSLLGDCTFCPKLCRDGCPVADAEASEAATPAWKGTLLRLHAEGRIPLAGAAAEAAYKCTDCQLQREHCLHDHDVSAAYTAARTAAVAQGVAPDRALSWIARLRRLGNPFAPDDEMRATLARIAGDGPLVGDGAKSPGDALFPGCTAVARAPDSVRDALLVLSRTEQLSRGRPEARVPCASAGAGCCGLPRLQAGDLDGFRAAARALAPRIAGIGRLVVLDPGCAHAIGTAWREHAGIEDAPPVTTVVEALHERLDAVRAAVRRPIAASIAYHDPCFLGRRRGVYDAPRALLEAACGGRAPTELATARERAWCAGAGGVYGKVWPESAEKIGDHRAAELAESGAERIATACPSCVHSFRKRHGQPRAGDVVSVLAEAMELR